ncbi:recombinase family protein [Mucilaginibacter sp. X5P1]|uniref:recombinase family protein n=1 Tax=Mucilaginibacter sp. X5P1 TaxID=2723088 RepID=UPI00160ED194|nr:recombinase family protein [Mucilaginibacter sp. X5P1]MBB6137706.1 DNA invertase Pin-like site-specific DNA recombinase [Mucilaginibacter sp. X5P1]
MKTADLYVRVSTDEQADKGYSQRSQEDVLRRYCEYGNIKVRRVIYEDHSAKTFIRPEWTKLLADLKKHKGKTDLLLFTKWDRFSRNASDAYYMISVLKKLGIEPVAIEQPLDTSVPENKMMLAVYLTAPEIENDRRGLNTFYGIRQAKKEGRWMGFAPIGYKNKTHENGKKYIAIDEPNASYMRWAFEQVGEGLYSAEQVLKLGRTKGLICSKNNFMVAMRNPCYMGKIRLAEFKNEPARFVDGLHQALISEALFYRVQDIIDGRKKQIGQPIYVPEMLPLRGFLQCPKCGRTLTGSASKGRNNYFYYYHCSSACGIRYRAEMVNDLFVSELQKYKLRRPMGTVYSRVVHDQFNNMARFVLEKRRKLVTLVTEQHNRLSKARAHALLDDFDPDDYRILKKDCEDKIIRLEAELREVSAQPEIKVNLSNLVEKAVFSLENIDSIYVKADIVKKREIIGSMFPEKIVFDGTKHRTGKTNEAIALSHLINSKLKDKKNGTESTFFDLPHEG